MKIIQNDLMYKAVSYGLQNIGPNFAVDKSQSYFNGGVKLGGGFLIGAFGGMAQYGIMKGVSNFSDFGTFANRFSKSTLGYLAEYSTNSMWNTGNRYPSYRNYHSYKMASFGVKSMFYTLLSR